MKFWSTIFTYIEVCWFHFNRKISIFTSGLGLIADSADSHIYSETPNSAVFSLPIFECLKSIRNEINRGRTTTSQCCLRECCGFDIARRDYKRDKNVKTSYDRQIPLHMYPFINWQKQKFLLKIHQTCLWTSVIALNMYNTTKFAFNM